MEKLSQHIEKLLVLHHYVVVPDFGGFVIQHQSAEILTDKIIPPRATVGFNPLMMHNDGLLVMEVCRFEKISYRQAVTLVQHEVNELRLKLNSTHTVQVGKIGVLQLENSGNIIFTPNNILDFLPQNLGLTALYLYPKNKKKRTEITITLPSRRFYKYAAVILMLFGLFLVVPRVSDVRVSDYASLVPKLEEKRIEKTVELKTTPPKVVSKQPISIVIEPEVIEKFHVVVASLPTKASADKFCTYLNDNNFKEAHVLEPVQTYRIAIESFSNKQEAIQFMENLRKTDSRFKTAWVLCEE